MCAVADACNQSKVARPIKEGDHFEHRLNNDFKQKGLSIMSILEMKKLNTQLSIASKNGVDNVLSFYCDDDATKGEQTLQPSPIHQQYFKEHLPSIEHFAY
ncbi:hypothetical protein V3C99_002725 [Haemonchus contortus]